MSTPETRPCVNGLTLRCLGAIGVGLAFVIVITTGLILISGDSETGAAARTASYTMKFPEDEQMLKDLSAQILKESHLTPGAKDAAAIEPATGGNPKPE